MALVVTLLGGESTGKTSLARALCGHLAETGLTAELVPEHLRHWCEQQGRAPHAHEQAAVAREQARLTDEMASLHGVDIVVADTSPLVIAVSIIARTSSGNRGWSGTTSMGKGFASTGSASAGFGCGGFAGSCDAFADGTARTSGRQSAAIRGRAVTEDVPSLGAGAGFVRSVARGRCASEHSL